MKKIYLSLLVSSLFVAVATPVGAAGSTGSFGVAATFTTQCTVSATDINFGDALPSPVASPISGQANLTATCSAGTAYKIGLGVGMGPNLLGCAGPRKLTLGSNTVEYNLFTNSGHTIVWGSGDPSCNGVVTGTGDGTPQTIPVFGLIPSGQTPLAGTYTDRIVATVSW